MRPPAAQAQATEVDVAIRDLKGHPGFAAYMVLNNDGIVIKHEGVEYKRAVQFAQLVLDLLDKAKRAVKGVLDAVDNEMESLRLKTRDYELLAGQSGAYTLIVVQQQQLHAQQQNLQSAALASTAGGGVAQAGLSADMKEVK